jgi:hypothetical protein
MAEIQMKICSVCNENKSIVDFTCGKRVFTYCTTCKNAKERQARKEKKEKLAEVAPPPVDKPTTKTCKKCNIEKDKSEFNGRTLTCKICDRAENNRPSETDPDKTCKTCNETKSALMFRKKEHNCKECTKKKLYEWRENNKERFLEICKNYRDKPEKKELRSNYLREKYNEDIKFRLEKLYRNRIRMCIKAKYLPKNSSFDYENILGCNWEIFMMWLEFNMKPEMKWDNYGSYWHIDHTSPCSLFDFSNEDERKRCFNWTNLTPLEGIENIKKSNKLDIDLINYYRKKAIEFMRENPDAGILTDNLPEDIKLLVRSGALTTKDAVKAVSGSGEKSEVG